MAVTAQAGIFGFSPESAKGSVGTTFYRHKATLIDLGLLDDVRVGPLEIGSGPFPTFPYKAGYVVGGGVEIQPRLEDTLGWLLYSALGDVTTTNPSTGVYKHVFAPDTTDLSFVRWLTLRKYIPKKEGDEATDMGEEYLDCKPIGLALTLPNDAPIAARWDFLGLSHRFVPNIGTTISKTNSDLTRSSNIVTATTTTDHGFVPGDGVTIAGADSGWNGIFGIRSTPTSTTFTYYHEGADGSPTASGTSDVGEQWAWDNTYEDWGSIPVGCEQGGGITFNGGGINEELPVVGARIIFGNQSLDLRQEKVFGSRTLEDITIIQRLMTFDVTVKWNNPRLYQAIITGNQYDLDWASRPLTGVMDISMVGTENIGSTNTKYQLDISAPEIMWQMNGPIQLAAGQAVMMRFTGTALEPTSGDYVSFSLYNGQSAYTWP